MTSIIGLTSSAKLSLMTSRCKDLTNLADLKLEADSAIPTVSDNANHSIPRLPATFKMGESNVVCQLFPYSHEIPADALVETALRWKLTLESTKRLVIMFGWTAVQFYASS